MIYGIGTDIVKISRIEKIIKKNDGFLKKVFTESEILYCSQKAYPAQHFAGNFAVKEAFLKAFGVLFLTGMKFHDFILCHKDDGMPYIKLEGETAKIFKEKKLKNIHVSISHDTDYAIAFVIIEK